MSFVTAVLRSRPQLLTRRAAAAAPKVTANGFWSTTPVAADEPPASKTPTQRISTQDLVKTLAETHELSQAESKRILATVFDTITESLSSKKAVSIVNFGTFSTYQAKERMARNPQTGESIHVPATERIRFRPYSGLKATVARK